MLFRKAVSMALVLTIALVGAGNLIAGQKGQWADVISLNGRDIALDRSSGKALFGQINSVDDSGLTLQIADKEGYSRDEIRVARDEVNKIWEAKLRFGNGNYLATGAIIVAGLGGVAGYGRIKAQKIPSGTVVLAIPVYAVIGSGIGGLIGFLTKKKHKKGRLVYSL